MTSRFLQSCFKVLIAFAVVTVLSAPYDADARRMSGGGGGMGGGGGGGSITSVYVPGASGLDPGDSSWNQAQAATVTLARFIDYVADGGGGMGGMGGGGMMDMCMEMGQAINRPVTVRSVHDGNTIFFRYQWADATADTTANDNNLFGDALAMEIPYSGGGGGMGGMGDTSLAMGTQTEPVNIIFWRAHMPTPHNIVGGGIGTPQHSPDAQNLQKYQNWSNGTWTVIVSRPMTGASDNQVTLESGTSYSVAFANWDGSDKNRNGRKAFSNWQTLTIQ